VPAQSSPGVHFAVGLHVEPDGEMHSR